MDQAHELLVDEESIAALSDDKAVVVEEGGPVVITALPAMMGAPTPASGTGTSRCSCKHKLLLATLWTKCRESLISFK